MSDPRQVQRTGASGTEYTYWVYTLPANLDAGQDGKCIYTMVENNTWEPVYAYPNVVALVNHDETCGFNQVHSKHHEALCRWFGVIRLPLCKVAPNIRMQPTRLRRAADAGRWAHAVSAPHEEQ